MFESYPISQVNKLIFLALLARPGSHKKNHPLIWDVLQLQGPWQNKNSASVQVPVGWLVSLHRGCGRFQLV